jgi:hypothetical protein
VFHDTRERFGGPPLDTRCHLASLPSVPSPVAVSSERGRFLPTAPATDRASDNLCRSPSFAELRNVFTFRKLWPLRALSLFFPREEVAKAAVTTFS